MNNTIKFRVLIPLLLALICSGLNRGSTQAQTIVTFETNLGDIKIELFDDTAPTTVDNFLGYVRRGDYEGTIFHRSVLAPPSLSIIQGGGFLTDGSPIPTLPPIGDEFGASNVRGTIAMARNNLGATSQFFFNTDDNSQNLDNQNGGFTTFGVVISGLDVVDAIQALSTIDGDGNPLIQSAFDDLPVIDTTLGVAVSNLITVSRATASVLGDVNVDGDVTFLDIAPFIALLAASGFQAEADCDCSGTLDFLDIAPFIAILSGQ